VAATRGLFAVASLAALVANPAHGDVAALGDTVLPAPRPGYLVPTSDPTLGALVTRIADDVGTPTAPVPGTWGADARHTYSKQQPWNADGSLLVLENRSPGSPSLLFLDGTDYTPRFGPCPSETLFDYRWHPARAHAHEMINVDHSGTRLSWVDVTTCQRTREWTLPIASQYGIGSGEGNPSNDGRFVALGNGSAMFVVDMDPQPPYAPYPSVRIGPVVAFPACSLSTGDPTVCRVSHLSVSASGRYVDVKYSGADSTAEAHRIFDVDPATLALTPHAMADSARRCGSFALRPDGWTFPLKHADLALDPFDGDEDVLVGGRACPGSNMGRVIKVRLRDGAVTALSDPTNEASVSHVSTRNLERPGWAYVSYFKEDGRRFSDEIVAVKLDGSRTVERFVHAHSQTSDCYRCEAHPVPSPDGRRILFASSCRRRRRACHSTACSPRHRSDCRASSTRSQTTRPPRSNCSMSPAGACSPGRSAARDRAATWRTSRTPPACGPACTGCASPSPADSTPSRSSSCAEARRGARARLGRLGLAIARG
jgi:hypothetical protein